MPALKRAEIETYLRSIGGPSTRITGLKMLGHAGGTDFKGYGYGTPVMIDFEEDGRQRRAVLHTVTKGSFGHEHMSDRAQALIWDHSAFSRLPKHVR